MHVLLHGRWLMRMTKRLVERLSARDLTRFDRHRSDPEWL
jgi:hypothetical protein